MRRRRRGTPEAWLTRPERVALVVLRAAATVCLLLGRRGTLLLLRPVVLFGALVLGERRRASRRWLRRTAGRGGGFAAVHRHLLRVARLRVDDVLLLAGRTDRFTFTRAPGPPLRRDGRGALLVGAHLGSLGALRVLARDEGCRVHVLLDGDRARLWNALLRRLDPEQPVRLIEAGPGALSAAVQVRELIEHGELVALLADRPAPGQPTAEVEFLGAPTVFPTAPFAMAAGLRCPVHLALALLRDGDGYELIVEPLLERVVVHGRDRAAALAGAVSRFAARLERHARRAPLDWWNLYAAWGQRPRSSRRVPATTSP